MLCFGNLHTFGLQGMLNRSGFVTNSILGIRIAFEKSIPTLQTEVKVNTSSLKIYEDLCAMGRRITCCHKTKNNIFSTMYDLCTWSISKKIPWFKKVKTRFLFESVDLWSYRMPIARYLHTL